jgi:hypothetical protein
MKLSKRQTYFAILAIWFFLCLLYQSIWIFSRTTTAKIYAVSETNTRLGSGIGRRGMGISRIQGAYSVGDRTYYGSYLKDGYDIRNPYFKIRYLIFDPSLSRSDTFASNWGPLIMFFLVMALVTSIAFLRKDIISDQAIFLLQAKRPFVKIGNNQIGEYDKHDLENKTPDEAEKALKEKLESGKGLLQMSDISASVYKFNPNAVGIFVVYMFFFFWFFYSLLAGSMGYPGILFWGAVLVFVPLYVQNTNNPVFKAKIPDEGSLIFSQGGVQFKEEFYSVDHIEAAVVYIESFQGFKYRERITTGNCNTISAGDNNKISFRYNQEVMDLTFILAHPSDYWAFKDLMSAWSAKGVNVILQKVFEDDFMIQEMVHFGTYQTSTV